MNNDELQSLKQNDPYLMARKDPTPVEQQLYLREVNYRCPLCGTILRKGTQKKQNKLYEIAHIYPNRPTPEQLIVLNGLDRLGDNSECFQNKIALCKNCHEAQDYHTTKEDYLKLFRIKKTCLQKTRLEDISEELTLEDDISTIVNAICNLTNTDFANINFDPLPLNRKFTSSDTPLKVKVSGYVCMYFTYIRNLFMDQEQRRSQVFTFVSMEMKLCFERFNEITDDKSLIFQKMVEWIGLKVPGSSVESREALVSFFVQNCEVFHEISE